MNQPQPSQPQTQYAEHPSIPAEQLRVAAEGAPKRIKSLNLPCELGEYITSYSDDSEEDQVALSRAMCPTDSTLEPYVGKSIRVAGAMLRMVELDDLNNPGERVQRIYCAMVLDDGLVIGTCSRIPIDQMAHLIRQREGKRGMPPAEYEVKKHPSKPPKQPYYSLRRIFTPAQGKGKGVAK